MKRHAFLAAGMAATFLASFALVAALDPPWLMRPGPWFAGGGALAALLGIGLLVADVLLPVPSSLVMVTHGALFGAAGGTLVSLFGVTAGAVLAFRLGRGGSARLQRFIPADERRRADRLMDEWGDLAVIVTRPVPILAETVALLAGTTSLRFRRFLALTLAGNLPLCVLYAVTGATTARLDGAFLSFGLVVGVAGAVWLVGRAARRGPQAVAAKEGNAADHAVIGAPVEARSQQTVSIRPLGKGGFDITKRATRRPRAASCSKTETL